MLAPGYTNIWRILIVCPGRVMHPMVISKHLSYLQVNLLIVNL